MFHDTNLLTVNTSIDSLSPESPIFPAMMRAPRASWVQYHNIYGIVPDEGFINRWSKGSDGIVSVESAKSDDAISQLEVVSRHQDIHRTPKAILEVRRILKMHLEETYDDHHLAERPNGVLLGNSLENSARNSVHWDESRPLPPITPATALGPNPIPTVTR
jgi:hypothetical protein